MIINIDAAKHWERLANPEVSPSEILARQTIRDIVDGEYWKPERTMTEPPISSQSKSSSPLPGRMDVSVNFERRGDSYSSNALIYSGEPLNASELEEGLVKRFGAINWKNFGAGSGIYVLDKFTDIQRCK